MTVQASPLRVRRAIYLGIGALATAIALMGFWPTYFGQIFTLTLDAPLVIHFHAIVFSGWLALLMTQAWLAATGRIAQHRKLGAWGMGYGVLIIFVGWLAAFAMFAMRVQAGEVEMAKARLFAPFTDMMFFAPVLGAAWAYRHKPEVHKRLIVVATTILLIAAAHRLIGNTLGRPPALGPVLAVWLSPIAVALAYDAIKHRIVHPVYLTGVAIVLAMKARSVVYKSDAWNALASWFVTLVPLDGSPL